MSEDRSKIILVNSANRTLGSPSDFNVSFHDGCIHGNLGDSLKLVVLDACINKSWFTVSESNNMFEVHTNHGLTLRYYIPVGYYDVNTLRAVLVQMTGFIIKYNKVTNCYTYTMPISNMDDLFYIEVTENRCGELLGFGPVPGVYGPIGFYNELITLIPIKMNKENSILIHCDVPKATCATLDNCSSRIFQESDVILKICNKCAPFDNIVYESQGSDCFTYDLSVTDITGLRFYVTDENNSPLSLKYDWTITLKIIFMREDDDQLVKVVSEIRDYLHLIVLNEHMIK